MIITLCYWHTLNPISQSVHPRATARKVITST